ncbi:MAG: flagellar motor protein MotB [Nitrospinota bacterium]
MAYMVKTIVDSKKSGEPKEEAAPDRSPVPVGEEFVKPPPPPPRGSPGAPMWIVTFADLATLMLTFFVLLLSFANMDIVKFEELMGSMQDAFGVSKEGQGSFMLMQEELGAEPGKEGVVQTPAMKDQVEKRALSQQMADAARRANFRDNVSINYTKDGINVRIDSGVMFKASSAAMKEEIVPFLKGVANIMRSFKFNLFIEGHTDNIPIRTKYFPSNWELSTVRATTVLRKLIELGVPSDRLAAVGLADTKPIRDNGTPTGRANNRRVEFKFIKIRTS